VLVFDVQLGYFSIRFELLPARTSPSSVPVDHVRPACWASFFSLEQEKMKARIFAVAIASALGIANVGFGQALPITASTFTLNHSTDGGDGGNGPSISGGVLTVTDSAGSSEANTAYYNTPVSFAGPFTASFVYQATNPSYGPAQGYPDYGADGFTFVMAALSDGTGSIGGRGGGLGWGTNDSQRADNFIPNSVALELTDDVYDGGGNGDNTGLVGAGPTGGSAGGYANTTLAFADPILVSISYDGSSTLTETLTDQTDPSSTYTESYGVDLASFTGSTGYIGFTGGSGGFTSTQTVSALTFTSVPEPTSLGLIGLAGAALMRRRRKA
jgi:hypothetical protein